MGGGLVFDETEQVARPATANVPLPAVLAMAAVAAAAIAQGAYHAGGQVVTGVLLLAALAVAVAGGRVRPAQLASAPFLIGAALAGWAVVSGAVSGSPFAGVPTVLLVAGAALVTVCSRPAGAAVLPGLIVLGVLVALSGLGGVAWRMEPWTLEDQGLWRAASTLTYANAAAGLLVPVTLVAAGVLVSRPGSVAIAAATCVLLAGTGATLSRGGVLALAVGGALLARAVGVRPLLRALGGPVVGALLTLAALAPSMVVGQAPRPLLAVLGLAAGLVIAVVPARAPDRTPALALLIVLPFVGLLLLSGGTSRVVAAARDSRLTLASPDRANEAAAALRVAAAHPLTGAGPGQASISWPSPDGGAFVADYAHNEYLQVLAELGVAGLALVVALAVSIGRRAARAWAPPPSPCRAGAAAGLAAVALHSGMDFLWHIPAIPLVCAVLVGVACFPPKGATE